MKSHLATGINYSPCDIFKKPVYNHAIKIPSLNFFLSISSTNYVVKCAIHLKIARSVQKKKKKYPNLFSKEIFALTKEIGIQHSFFFFFFFFFRIVGFFQMFGPRVS